MRSLLGGWRSWFVVVVGWFDGVNLVLRLGVVNDVYEAGFVDLQIRMNMYGIVE